MINMSKTKKSNIRLDRLIKLIFLVLVFIFLIYLFVSKIMSKPQKKEDKRDNKTNVQDNTQNDNKEKQKINVEITENSEQNSDVVKEYFVNGMSVDDYKSVLTKEINYLKSEGKYEQISYNFEDKYHYSYFEEIFNKLNKSSVVKVEIIGKSVDNRNLYSIEIGSGEEVTVFEAGIHSGESASPLFITKFMIDLVNKYENGDEDTINLLKNNKIVVLPFANPDGYEVSFFGKDALNNKDLFLANYDDDDLIIIKSNANGVDLNRNFPSQTSGLYYDRYDLHSTVSKTQTSNVRKYFPGSTLGSEPETRAIMYLQNKWIDKLKTYVALHSAGRVIYNGKPYLSNEYNNTSHDVALVVGNITGYTVLSKADEDSGEGNDGTSSEYMAESLSGFKFSTETGRLSSDSYAKYYDDMKYHNTAVIVIEALEGYTINLDTIKDEYYDYDLAKAYLAVIKREK